LSKLQTVPLVVDLDGSLIRSDMLHESFVQSLLRRPLSIARLFTGLFKGKAAFKAAIAEQYTFEAAALPYNEAVLEVVNAAKQEGRQVVLASASDSRLVQKIADHLGVFDSVLSTQSGLNLSGSAKADALDSQFGAGNYEYVGNANVDLKVWARATGASLVSPSTALLKKAKAVNENVTVIAEPKKPILALWFKQLRIYHWPKNLLLFVPAFTSYGLFSLVTLAQLVSAIIAFGLVASSVYLINDLADLDNDRVHHSKRNRPLAAGRIPLLQGLAAAVLFVVLGLALGLTLGFNFFLTLCVYLATTFVYSFWLKRWAIIDCIVLAFLYTLRVFAGAAATGLVVSYWLLAFSAFLFLSLAWVKRYAELAALSLAGQNEIKGRGYSVRDIPVVLAFGVASGFMAVLVFALYLDSDAVNKLYVSPELGWLAIPLFLYLIGRIWLKAHRGEMNEDPLIFAFKDIPSIVSALLIAGVLLVAHLGLVF